MISRLRTHYVAEHRKDWDTFVFRMRYMYNVQIYRTKMVPSFSLAITWLPPGSTAVARSMPPAVSKIDPLLSYQVRLIHRAALLTKMATENIKKKPARYRKNYDKNIPFEPPFPAGYYVLVERPPLMTSAPDRMAYEGYSKLLLCHTGLDRLSGLDWSRIC